MISSDIICEEFNEECYHLTDNPEKAIYIFPDGLMMSGDYDSV